ncbi:MAG: hypothetical protein HUK15_00965, partial [Bacteroidales bacterium]|nr:hypothetical protein [Bacteroidales bacterium]
MKTKKLIIILVTLLVIAGAILAFMSFFGFYTANFPNGDQKMVFVKKSGELQVGDMVAYRYPLHFDTKLSSRDVYVSRIVA